MNASQDRWVRELFPDAVFAAVDPALFVAAERHLDQLTKPRGSLGRLEEIAMRLYAISGGKAPLVVDPALIYTAAGDHGVARQGVSPYPQIVTRQMVNNFLAHGAAINALCNAFSIRLKIIDAGCAGGPFPEQPDLISRRLGEGTADLSQTVAMNPDTAIAGLRSGFALAHEAKNQGFHCLGLGEMGIANSTSASALFCALLDLAPEKVVGPGCGASPAMQERKIRIVEAALRLHAGTVHAGNPLLILAALGGFEIAVLAGLMLGCAQARLPFVVDGFICTAAYALARAIWQPLGGFAFLAHNSAEPGYGLLMDKLGENPLLSLEMRLGEGTGCALAINLLRGACAIFNDMATLSAAGVNATNADRMD